MPCASVWLAIDLKCKIDPKSSINHQNDINELIYVKGDQANFFFFRILTFLNVALRCFIFVKIPTFYIWPFNTLTQTLPHLNSGFQHSQMGFLIMFDENIFHKKGNLLDHPLFK